MKKIVSQLILILGFSILSYSAIAEGLYFGADLGQTDYEGEDATSFRLLAGFPVNESFSIEVAWLNQGEASESGIDPFFGPYSAKLEASGIQIAGIAALPLQDNMSLFGKVGLYIWEVDVEFSDFSGTFSGEDDGSDLTFGFGMSLEVNDEVSVRGSYEIINIDLVGESFDADMFSVGITIKVN